ncbi:response regulator [Candidatus Peregrinibacteria bacterium]|nr:response regulator [Candidatus Peregrinibacteria bacterium]
MNKANPQPKVLIIDDEIDLCKLFKKILRHEGYTVYAAQSGTGGIKINEKSNPELIILDLKMPEMSGIETLRRIRKKDKDVIVIILTGYGDAETIRNAADLNVYDYMSKPFNIEMILKIIREALAPMEKKGE